MDILSKKPTASGTSSSSKKMRSAVKHILLLCLTLMTVGQLGVRSEGIQAKLRADKNQDHKVSEDSNGRLSRSLASLCSSYTSCSECSLHSSCSYLNGVCTVDPQYSIAYQSYNQASEYAYCKNAVSQDYITYDKIEGNTLELAAGAGASASDHPLCEWRIDTNHLRSLKIEISRNVGHYEDIYVYLYFLNGYQQYSSRDLATCSGEPLTLNLSNVSYVKIRAKMLNDASNYSFKISQPGNEETSELFTIIVIVSLISFFVVLIAISVGILIWVHRWSKRQQNPTIKMIMKNRTRLIQKTLAAMLTDHYCNLDLRFDQKSCVICLGDFSDMDEVCLTNECDHSFHPECLKSWFENIVITKHIFCPNCTTQVTAVKQKMRPASKVKTSEMPQLMNSDNISSETESHRTMGMRILTNTIRITPTPFSRTTNSMNG